MDIKKIRSDFPCLGRKNIDNGKPPIYLDNACMTLKPKQVIAAITNYYENFPACGGHGRSGHWFAKEVQEAVDNAREKVRLFINAREGVEYSENLKESRNWIEENDSEETREIIWTRNTTESLNLVANCFKFEAGDTVITTDREHNSNLTPWQELKRKKGINYEIMPSNEDNTFNVEKFHETMNNKVKLVSMVHTSNLDGYTIPAKEVIEISHDYGAKVILDCAQSAPHKKIDVQELDADFIAFSSHKMCGPTGMGILYGKIEELVDLEPFIVGGDTVVDTWYDNAPIWMDPPYKYEAGLQNYAGQIGTGAAVDYLMEIGMEDISKHEYKLNKFMSDNLRNYDEIEIIGPEDPGLRSGICTFFVKKPGLGGHDGIDEKLNRYNNIMVRSGTFCVHSWFHGKNINNMYATSVRASTFIYNTLDECKIFIDTLDEILNEPQIKELPLKDPYN